MALVRPISEDSESDDSEDDVTESNIQVNDNFETEEGGGGLFGGSPTPKSGR